MIGKKYMTKDDLEAFARKISRRVVGRSIGGTGSSSSAPAFTDLTDTPSSYPGSELFLVRVNAAGTALEFFEIDLGDISDVDFSSPNVPADGDALVWDAGSGTWIPGHRSEPHNLLGSTEHPDTVTGGVTAGDLIRGNATPKWERLAAGREGAILEMGAALPAWGRKITASAIAPVDGDGQNGDIHIQY